MRFRRKMLNPLTELTAASLVVVLMLVVDRWQFSLAVLVLVVLPMALLSGKAHRIALALLVVMGPMLVFTFLLHGLFFPEGETVLADLGVAKVTAEGLHFAISITLRLAVFAGMLLTAVLAVSVPELIATMTHHGWNRKLVYIIGSSVGLIPQVTERGKQITRAQQARGLVVTRNPVSRLRALLVVGTPLVTGLLVDAAGRAHMLEARGFTDTRPRTSYAPDTDTPAQRAARWVMLGVVVLSFLWYAIGAPR